jgi:acyl-CoA dehydrogenase
MTVDVETTEAITAGTDWVAVARDLGLSLRDGVAERDRTAELAHAGFDRARRSGLTAALVPADRGGGGATHAELGAALRALGRQDPATAVALSMHSHLVAAQVWRHRHGMDADGVFAKVVGGALLLSTGASDWVGSSGRARRVDDGFVVDADKGPVSGCEAGDVLVTSVRWDDAPEGPQVLHLSVPMAAPGISIERTWDTLGMRATGSHTVHLREVLVPDAAVSLIRPADAWPTIWNVVIGAAMPLIVAAYLGVADAAVDAALAAVRDPAPDHAVQLVGEMANAHTTAEDAVAGMFAAAEDLHFAATDAASARMLSRKTVAADALVETVRLAIEVVGGVGYSRSCDLERLYRDVHGVLFHPLPRARQTTFTGRVLLGHTPLA